MPVDTLMSYCNEAKEQTGWTVIMHHGVGGPGLETERHVHQAFLDSLDNPDFGVAPVRKVAAYIREHRTDIPAWP